VCLDEHVSKIKEPKSFFFETDHAHESRLAGADYKRKRLDDDASMKFGPPGQR